MKSATFVTTVMFVLIDLLAECKVGIHSFTNVSICTYSTVFINHFTQIYHVFKRH